MHAKKVSTLQKKKTMAIVATHENMNVLHMLMQQVQCHMTKTEKS